VLDTTLPTIDSPDDIEYESGTTGHSITWQPSDADPDSYEVYRNNGVIDNGAWNVEDIIVVLDGLGIGVYNYTLVIHDGSGNSASETVLVIVVEASTTTTGTTTTDTAPTTTEPRGMDPVLLVITLSGTLGVVIILLVIYIKKRR
jgi:hypothetical protein